MDSAGYTASEFQSQGLKELLEEIHINITMNTGNKFMEFLALEVTETKNINEVENYLDPFLGGDTIAY